MGGGVVDTQTKCVGFTLAELLGVIIIIGVLALLILPTIEKSIKDSKEKLYQTQIKNIEMAANDWALDHLFELPDHEGETTTVLLGQLKVDGYIDTNVSDPRDGVKFPNDMEIVITRKYNNYVYGVVEGSGTPGNTELPDVTVGDVPVITLNGSKVVTIEVGSSYTELGATAKYQEEDISSSIVITGSVDTSQVGNYSIHYNVSYEDKVAKEVIRVVRVVGEGEAPITPTEGDVQIVLNPSGTSTYAKATTVNVKASTVGSKTITSLTYRLNSGASQNVENNKIVLDQDGIYVIEVTAVDSEGKSNTVTSSGYLIDVTAPELHFSEEDTGVTLTSSLVPLYNLKNGVSVVDNNSINIDNVIVSGEFSSKPGTYDITYKATDVAGNVTTKTRKITVVSDSGSGGGGNSEGGNFLAGVVVNDSDVMTNDPDGNLRYVGKNPNNYVKFNNELWRIIGVFDGQAKIVRNEPYNISIAWHNSTGVNYWAGSSLRSELNSTFLSRIDATSKSYIDTTHIWRLGGYNSNFVTRAEWYAYERGSLTSYQESVWVGAIGLMYPSDYGYSTSSTLPECSNTALVHWNREDGITCRDNSWLYSSSYNQWTITPFSPNSATHVLYVSTDGYAGNYIVTSTSAARPALYLRSSVKITGGSGTSSSPYILSL